MTTSLIFGDNKQKVTVVRPEVGGNEAQGFTLNDDKELSLVINQVTGNLEISDTDSEDDTNFSDELQREFTPDNILDIKYKNKENAEVAELSIITDTVDMFSNGDSYSKSKINGLISISIEIPFNSSQEAEVRIKVEKNNDKYRFTLSAKDSDNSNQSSENSDADKLE